MTLSHYNLLAVETHVVAAYCDECKPSSLVPVQDPDRTKNLVAKIKRHKGIKPLPDESLEKALELIAFEPATSQIPYKVSGYLDPNKKPLFRQGATVTPKVLTVISRVETTDKLNQVNVTTSRSQHAPWHEINPQNGDVPEHWVRDLIISKDVLPFSIYRSESLRALIPINDQGILDKTNVGTCNFWTHLGKLYEEYKGKGKNTPQDLIERMGLRF